MHPLEPEDKAHSCLAVFLRLNQLVHAFVKYNYTCTCICTMLYSCITTMLWELFVEGDCIFVSIPVSTCTCTIHMYMYVCMYMYVFVFLYLYLTNYNIHVHVLQYVYIYVHTCTCTVHVHSMTTIQYSNYSIHTTVVQLYF